MRLSNNSSINFWKSNRKRKLPAVIAGFNPKTFSFWNTFINIMMLATNSLRRIGQRCSYPNQTQLLHRTATAAAGQPHNIPRWLSTASTPTGSDDDDEAEPPVPVPPTDDEEEPVVDVPPPPPPKATIKSITESIDELEKNMKPSQIVEQLDRHIVGQPDAKKAVAIAMRNRWRRRQLPEELRKEVTPRNVLLVGPTGAYLCRLFG